jgi:alkylation response protein AidB-like acyl-CoA dehydrogenase
MAMIVNRRDLDFLLFEVHGIDALFAEDRFRHLDRATFDSMLDTAQSLAEDAYLPLAALMDREEPVLEAGAVRLPEGVAAAIRAYGDAGLFAQTFDEGAGGLQLPYVASVAINGMFSTANQPLAGYAMLTVAAAHLLETWGDERQKAVYLPPMLEGRWFGTMCLSEPQAGSSLADIVTRAEPQPDGDYNIQGTKMWISGGEHDLAENIVHMVLAKIPGGPPGVKGISLFIVPKCLPDQSGAPDASNNILLVGLNHKLGHRGTTNCLLNFGEVGPTKGYLVGKPHEGLRYMFHMMNEARISVGHGAVSSGLAGYLYSLDYASDRLQGRLLDRKDPKAGQIAIIEHPDVRRMLLQQRAAVEGGLSLILYCSALIDRAAVSPPDVAADLRLMLDVLTPIAKSWPSEHCLEANKLAIQVLGGAGYVRDHPVERFYRDNRLNPIHEGTYGIQGLDLLDRKVRLADGRGLDLIFNAILQTVADAQDHGLTAFGDQLQGLLAAWKAATEASVACSDRPLALANANAYLDAAGRVVVGWLWLQQAIVASRAALAHDLDAAFYEGKLITCRFYFAHMLPSAALQFDLVRSLEDSCIAVRPEHFHAGRAV